MNKYMVAFCASAACASVAFHPTAADAFTTNIASASSCLQFQPFPSYFQTSGAFGIANTSTTQLIGMYCPITVPYGDTTSPAANMDVYSESSTGTAAYATYQYFNGSGNAFSGPFYPGAAGVSQIVINSGYFSTTNFNSVFLILEPTPSSGNDNTFFGYTWGPF